MGNDISAFLYFPGVFGNTVKEWLRIGTNNSTATYTPLSDWNTDGALEGKGDHHKTTRKGELFTGAD
jgi:hypothetical protein